MFTDDAIRIEKYYDEYGRTAALKYLDVDTKGSLSVHINSNRNGNGRQFENWLDYAVGWCGPASRTCTREYLWWLRQAGAPRHMPPKAQVLSGLFIHFFVCHVQNLAVFGRWLGFVGAYSLKWWVAWM